MPRYVLLLNELLKKTPEGHNDQIAVRKAIEQIENVVANMDEQGSQMRADNKVKKLAKSLEKFCIKNKFAIDAKEATRVLVKSGTLMVTNDQEEICGEVFLFKDILILTDTMKGLKVVCFFELAFAQILALKAQSKSFS